MTVSDGRAAAWASSWLAIETARKLREEVAKVHGIDEVSMHQYQLQYDCLITEAQIFSQLAAVDVGVGISVGTWLEERAREREERQDFLADLGRDIFKNKEPEGDSDAEQA